jgi:hypothetical protein
VAAAVLYSNMSHVSSAAAAAIIVCFFGTVDSVATDVPRMRAQLSRSGRLVCWLVGGWFLARHTLISMVAECGVCVYVSCQKQRSV